MTCWAPRPFVFRLDPADPHPIPWLRVKASCTFGDYPYPHPQWKRLATLWQALYPATEVDPAVRDMVAGCERALPELAELIGGLRPSSLRARRSATFPLEPFSGTGLRVVARLSCSARSVTPSNRSHTLRSTLVRSYHLGVRARSRSGGHSNRVKADVTHPNAAVCACQSDRSKEPGDIVGPPRPTHAATGRKRARAR